MCSRFVVRPVTDSWTVGGVVVRVERLIRTSLSVHVLKKQKEKLQVFRDVLSKVIRSAIGAEKMLFLEIGFDKMSKNLKKHD